MCVRVRFRVSSEHAPAMRIDIHSNAEHIYFLSKATMFNYVPLMMCQSGFTVNFEHTPATQIDEYSMFNIFAFFHGFWNSGTSEVQKASAPKFQKIKKTIICSS